MKEQIVRKITLSSHKEAYLYRSRYLRARAVRESLEKGVMDSVRGNIDGVPLVEQAGSEMSLIPLPLEDHNISLAINADGIAFGRIEEGLYFPIDTSSAEASLKEADRYKSMAGNLLKRLIYAPYFKKDTLGFNLDVEMGEVVSSLREVSLMLHMAVDRIVETMRGIEDNIERINEDIGCSE